jgi:DNA repair exonuclease SbcCD ATPase subunit
MIPQRIVLSGFLCYKDEQQIDFQGAPVWLLAGLNGSGKSAVFDAVTFALFGHHRGGSKSAEELINKDSTGLVVGFEFTIDGKMYRARRTVRRTARGNTSGTQQMAQWDAAAQNGAGDFVAIEDTNRKVDFDRWIDEHLGLSYETFTSSVLLLQGRAEKLLDSAPSGRHQVLAGIVELERYQRLHERASADRQARKAEHDTLAAQFAGVPEVTDGELALADEQIASATATLQTAQASVEQLQQVLFQAEQWAKLTSQIAQLRTRIDAGSRLLSDAAGIERAHARWERLREVIPHLTTVVTQRRTIDIADTNKKKALLEQQEARQQAEQAAACIRRATQRRARAQDDGQVAQAQLRTLGEQLRDLEGALARSREVQRQQQQAEQLDRKLATLPTDLPATVARLQQQVDDQLSTTATLQLLTRFAQQRQELIRAEQLLAEAQRHESHSKTAGLELKTQREQLAAQLASAETARSQAETATAEAKATEASLREFLASLEQLEGKKTCRACGQRLTAKHVESEKALRQPDWVVAQQALSAAQARLSAAQLHEKTLKEQLGTLEQKLLDARSDYRVAQAQCKTAHEQLSRNRVETATAFAALPETQQARVSADPAPDFRVTEYPTTADLAAVRTLGAGLTQTKTQLADVRKQLSDWQSLTGQRQAVQQSLAHLHAQGPCADLAQLHTQQKTLQTAERQARLDLKVSEETATNAQSEMDQQTKLQADRERQVTHLAGVLSAEEVARKHAHDAILQARKHLLGEFRTLAEAITTAELHRLKQEFDDLEAQQAPSAYEQLQIARQSQSGLHFELASREQELAGIPAAARRAPATIAQERATAQTTAQAAEREVQLAQRHKLHLETQRQQRNRISEQMKTAEKALLIDKTLAELLGRERLQRHLVRQAERQIVDHANAVLDRLTGGQLSLRLVGSDDGTAADKALDLEVFNRQTGGSAINVAFLSGSQRFRVAVSLALGIGQYASKQHRPIESVIIDEGFGCLDRQGRQVMIQELQNLRGQLNCVLLVSHQDEFIEAFPNSYRFELQAGSTVVTRAQR